MTQFKIKVAGYVAAVAAMYDSSRAYCRDYLCEEPADFSVEITAVDLALEQQKHEKTCNAEGRDVTPVPNEQLELTAIQRKIAEGLFAYDALIFHSSAVAVDGVAYLFTAKSGTGKSTHTRLWRQMFGDRAVMVNDDKPFLRMSSNGVMVYGSPWNGKHRLGSNICVPLKAICVLERGEVNEIVPIAPEEALSMLLQQSNRPTRPSLLPKYLELLDKLAGGTVFYRLRCNMDSEAALVAYQAMSRE